MPLIQSIQKRVGKENLDVLLVSVDQSYMKDQKVITKNLHRTLHKRNVDWPCVIEPDGWLAIVRRFNCDGYGLALIGSDGTVRGVHLRVEDVERLLETTKATPQRTRTK